MSAAVSTLVTKATVDDDVPPSGYLFNDLKRMINTAIVSSVADNYQ